MIGEALRPRTPRRPTRPGRAAVERRLDEKRQTSARKRTRSARPATTPRPAVPVCAQASPHDARVHERTLLGRLEERAAAGRPIGVAVVGGGVFASLYLAQARRTPGIHIVGVADLAPGARARAAAGGRLARGRARRAQRGGRAPERHDLADRRRRGADRRAGRRGRDRGDRRCARRRRARACSRSRRAATWSWSTSRPTRSSGRCSRGARTPRASSTRSPTATSPR